jgi:trigger factor
VLQLASVDDVQLGDDQKMSFTATVVTQPEFEIPEYNGLPIEAKSSEVTEKKSTSRSRNLREQAADFTDVPERGAEMDDFIVVDYVGTINDEPVHKLFPQGRASRCRATMTSGFG